MEKRPTPLITGFVLALLILGINLIIFHSFPSFASSTTDVRDDGTNFSVPSSQESSQEILSVKKGKEKYSCLEGCAKTRYQCETGNRGKNKVGTKKNWEESGKCEKKYRTCLDKCEVD